jgi:hypothetical protein
LTDSSKNDHTIRLSSLWLAVFLTAICGCSQIEDRSDSPAHRIETNTWEDADRLFRDDPNWLGGDGAYSIDLEDGRVLWLFGDSFVAVSEKRLRNESVIVRNSIGVQTGYDPSTAGMDFYWRGTPIQPAAFFPENGDSWYWPGHGIRLNKTLLVFLMVIQSDDNPLGFREVGWRAVTLSELETRPLKWALSWLTAPAESFGVIVGSGSVLLRENFVYAFGYQSRSRKIYAVRWLLTDISAGKIDRLQWWTGQTDGWIEANKMSAPPAPLLSDGQTEFTVHYEPKIDRFLEIQTVGFGAARIGMRWSKDLTGPWSPLEAFFLPEEHRLAGILIYAAKAHPHLAHHGLVLTYVTNALMFDRVVQDDRIYYPRFVTVAFNQN